MKFEQTQVMNFEGALRGMRNPLASWHKSDSDFNKDDYCVSSNPEENCTDCEYFQGFGFPCFKIGPNDMDLARRLISGGTEHRKFLRQIMVSVDITAPLYWWKEFDTYKVGTTANSTSTMHKLASTPITLDCFETDDFVEDLVYFTHDGDTLTDYTVSDIAQNMIEDLEALRQKYNETKDKRYWKELVRWLPNGWLQTRTVTMNYENLRSMYHQRENHKLTEWHSFCDWVKSLPYAQELIID
jgi:hypothetical protein